MYKFLANTIFLGKDIFSMTECHSTNDVAMDKIRKKQFEEGTIVIAEYQTQGKGQRGNIWQSEAGKNLTFSLILKPNFLDPTEQFDLNIIISLAILEVLSEYSHGIKLKWPNDLIHDMDGKIGGILIENIIGQRGIEVSVAGIGLNINQRFFTVLGATSLINISRKELDRWEIFKLIISKIEEKYIAMQKGNNQVYREAYIQNLYRLGTWGTYQDEEKFTGRIEGVTAEGKLIIIKEDGSRKLYGYKEVTFL